MKLFLITALLCALAASSLADPCDLWTRYTYVIDPALNGFNAGTSAYFWYQVANLVTPAYVARGFYNGVMIPGRVQKPLSTSYGAIYVTAGDEERANPTFTSIGGGEYFINRDGCTCTWSTVTAANTALLSADPNLVRTSIVANDYAIAKITNAGMVSIGKSVMPTLNTLFTHPQSTLELGAAIKSVLVCSGTNMWTKPVVNFGPVKNCALWSKYKPSTNANWPAAHGLLFGLDRLGNPGYVGRGTVDGLNRIGRVQITTIGTSTAGVYVPSYSNEVLAIAPEYLVVPYYCNCFWMPYTLARLRPGIIRSVDDTFGFGIGRVPLGDGKFSMASVRFSAKKTYVTLSGSVVYDEPAGEVELLVCETL